MKNSSDILSTCHAVLEKINKLAVKEGKTQAVTEVEELQRYIHSLGSAGIKTVTVILGEFKRGKSSFINALLGEEICPVNTDITTSIVSQIQYGATNDATVYFTNQETKTIKKEEVSRYVTEQENQDNVKQVQLVDIMTNNKQLQDTEMIIVDTPGLGALNKSHSEITLKYLAKADIILFVSDATSPFTTSELEIIETAYRISKHLYFVMTKIDLIRGWKEIVQENQKKLRQLLPELAESTTFIPVSSHYKWDYVENQDIDSLSFSNFEYLEQLLFQELQSKVASQKVAGPIMETRKILQENFQKPFFQDQKSLHDLNPKEAILAQIQEEKARKGKLQRTAWVNKLSEAHTELRFGAKELLEDRMKQLSKKIEAKMKDKNFYKDTNGVNQYLNNELFIISTEIDHLVDGFVAEMFRYLQTEYAIDSMVQEEDGLFEQIDVDAVAVGQFERKSAIDKTMSYVRHFSGIITFSSLGSISGGLISTVLGGAVASGIGMVALAVGGAIVFLSRDKVKTVELLNECKEIIREARTTLNMRLDKTLYKIQKEIRETIEKKLKSKIEECDQRSKELEIRLNLNSVEFAKMKTEMENKGKVIAEIDKELIAVLKEVQKSS
ncbi:dynamin family protein [Brevibacillus fluminis]|uniref:dynamin family protein n=1 Tax=Brevibacillus fluminis TaxID=511487 RepID=UPI003F8AF365